MHNLTLQITENKQQQREGSVIGTKSGIAIVTAIMIFFLQAVSFAQQTDSAAGSSIRIAPDAGVITNPIHLHGIGRDRMNDESQERIDGESSRTSAEYHEKVIHYTDVLYRNPEIKEAYQKYLDLKETRPDDLLLMEQPAAHEIGDTVTFNVYNIEESNGTNVYDQVDFVLRAMGERSELWVELEEYDPEKVNDEVVSSMMAALEESTPARSVNPDQGIILNNIDFFANGDFSNVPDPEGNGKVKVLVTNVQDGWDPDESPGFVAGFFNPADLAPRSVNSNSNEAAIIYINSYPGIYRDNVAPNPDRPLSVIAHEFQHLIQAGRGNLITFMDEGQSELSEILNGFNARMMEFLNIPDEVNGTVEADGFLRWRRGESEVLKDYQRAQLFHSYLYERLGWEIIGSLTLSDSGRPWTQYQRVLNKKEEGLEFREVLAEFYAANWVNDRDVQNGKFGYSLQQLGGVRVNTPGQLYDANVRPWISNRQVGLAYGSAKYTHWLEAEDLYLEVSSPSEIIHYVYSENDSGVKNVERLHGSEMELTGLYRSVVLISVNTVVQTSSSYGSRSFSYSADWTPGNLQLVSFGYAEDPPTYFFPVPVEDSQQQGIFDGISVRIDPEIEGRLQSVDVMLNNTETAIQGTGTLRASIWESQRHSGSGRDAVYIPSDMIASVDVVFENLNPSINNISFAAENVELKEDTNYHIYFQAIDFSNDAELQFILDQGSDDKENDNYYPVRTLRSFVFNNGDSIWTPFGGDLSDDIDNENKNLFMTVNILGRIDGGPGHPDPAVSDNFMLLPNYPNPFNNTTNIRFNIPDQFDESIPVKLDVFDITGRHVATIADENLHAGVHSFSFEAEQLASGIYITRLVAGGTVQSRKITLVK